MRIIVDAFGGDNAPLEIIKGSMLAVDEFGIDVILCGSEKEIMKCVNENKIELKNTQIYNTDAPAIEMNDDAKCVLKERQIQVWGLDFLCLIRESAMLLFLPETPVPLLLAQLS